MNSAHVTRDKICKTNAVGVTNVKRGKQECKFGRMLADGF